MTLVNLHFVGPRLYSPEKMENEAARVGVARRLPSFAIRTLAFGDTVLMATFQGPRTTDGRVPLDGEGAPIRIGVADAWGSFVVEGLNIDAPDEFKVRLANNLHIVKVEEFEEPVDVERECGSYTVTGVAFVTDDLKEIIAIGERIAMEMGIVVKWSVTGTFHPLAPHIAIDGVPFTRTLVQVELDGWSPFAVPEQAETDGRPLYFIGDYASRRYKLLSPEARAEANRRRGVNAAKTKKEARR